MPHEVQAQHSPAERIEALVQEVAAFADPHARATAEELVQTLLGMYGEGLARLLEITAESEASGIALIDTFASDELLSSLFLLHGLHPIDIETRIMEALDEVRPYLKSHGGNVEFVRVEDGVAHLRLEGSCNGCSASTITLKSAIEEAIYKAAPDLNDLQVEGVVPPPKSPGVPITFVSPRKHKDAIRRSSAWSVVEGLATLPEGTLQVVSIQGEPLLFSQIADTYYAYRNHCPNCNAPLDTARLEETILSCSSCGRQYDFCRAGRNLDASDLSLEPIPLLVEDGKVKVTLAALEKTGQSQPTLSIQAR